MDRTFGWVQNPGNLDYLHRVVQIFDVDSEQYAALRDELVATYIPIVETRDELQEQLDAGVSVFSYRDLVGRSRLADGSVARSRPAAVADSLIQVTIPSQSAETRQKYWTDNWTADGYLRWAVSLNFVEYIRASDQCQITPLGLRFSRVESEAEFNDLLVEAFLRYPPASRILAILEASRSPLNKFELGHQLGFSGEAGFTSYSSEIMIEYLRRATTRSEATKIRADVEGTADKYARMICGWLSKVGLVTVESTSIEGDYLGEIAGFREFSITAQGIHRLRQAQGGSSNSRISKFVMWEFFATTGSDRTYVRTRRALILQLLMNTSRKSWNALLNDLQVRGVSEDPAIIRNDIDGLKNIGLRIDIAGGFVMLRDKVMPFSIPNGDGRERRQGDIDRTAEKAEFLSLTKLPARFIELLSIAYNSNSNRDFEIITAELFRDVYGLESVHFGGVRKPDALVFTDDFGIIVDTKAYSNGYSKNINQEDEMVRYIEDNQQRSSERNSNEWWLNFSSDIPENSFHYLWVSSFFTGQFDDQLRDTFNRTGVSGGALSVRDLLIGASLVQERQLDANDLPAYMQNRLIQFD